MSNRTEIELRPTRYRADGSAVHYDVERHQAQPPAVGWDDGPIVSPLPAERVVRSVSIVEGTWSDRARAFNLSTLNLAVVTGGLAIVGALVFGASVSFFTLALVFFGGFAVAWLAAYAMHTVISAEGAQVIEVLALWAFLRREQANRFRRQGAPDNTTARTVATVVLLALAIGATLLFVLAMIAAVVWENTPQ